MLLSRFPRVSLAHLPTPLEHLPAIAAPDSKAMVSRASMSTSVPPTPLTVRYMHRVAIPMAALIARVAGGTEPAQMASVRTSQSKRKALALVMHIPALS